MLVVCIPLKLKVLLSLTSPAFAWARMDTIITRFASKIRNLTPLDPLMKAAGVSGFVQSVLVPELTVMLVKEDMDVGDEDARQIMRESMEIGELLNEQPDDVVTLNVEEQKK